MTDCVAWGQILGERDNQEDAISVQGPERSCADGDLLLVLADGMGGHAGGEVASRLAVTSFVEHFRSVSTNPRPRGRFGEALQVANAKLAERIASEPELRGMGCTLLGVLIAQGRLVWVSVGDSLLFLMRNGRLSRLNADHSLFGELQELVERGEMTRAEAEAHPRRNALRSALTGGEVSLTDLNAIEIDPGDVVILASDGIETLEQDEIERIVQSLRAAGPEAVKQALLDAVSARRRPRQDNTSIVVMMADRAPGSVITGRGPASGARRFLGSPLPAMLAGGLALAVLGLGLVLSFGGGDTASSLPPSTPLNAPDRTGLVQPRGGSAGPSPIVEQPRDGGPQAAVEDDARTQDETAQREPDGAERPTRDGPAAGSPEAGTPENAPDAEIESEDEAEGQGAIDAAPAPDTPSEPTPVQSGEEE